jgi:hypothetical protein
VQEKWSDRHREKETGLSEFRHGRNPERATTIQGTGVALRRRNGEIDCGGT